MQELEKILEEIEARIAEYRENVCLEIVDICYGLREAEKIIRKHMNDGKCGECSRRKWYQKGYEDGKNNNDGWIPVEERLPEEDAVLVQVSGKPRKNITLENAYEFAEYAKGEGWILENYPDWENPEVHAWQPLPDPYCPERSEEE